METCKNKTPENYLVVGKNGILKRGVGCFEVLIQDSFHPECSEEICPKNDSLGERG